jgi:hypothetical protein
MSVDSLGSPPKVDNRGVGMKFAAIFGLSALSLSLMGCASITEGTTQDISVVTNPFGATCVFERQGMVIGTIVSTPATLNVPKRKYDITIRCNKPGFQEAAYLNHSGLTAVIAANVATDLLLTGGLSSIIDSADGADNKYDSAVNITMIPLQQASR